ncbi:COP9 signalosome complex subunit 8 [Taenia solium]|eukprot:TsM_000683600 transcript=TsM_000683600 gene=TsM_000683600
MDQGDSSDSEVCSQILELENSEMASGVLSSSQYLSLLCLYLRNDSLMAARFLWKRIPNDCKTGDPYLQSVWNLTVLLLRRRNQEFLSSCREFLRTEALPEQAVLNTSSGGCSSAVEPLRLQCPQCSFHTTSSITLRQHAWRNHLDENQTFQSRFYTCSKCTATTTDLNSLRDHFAHAHDIHEPDNKLRSGLSTDINEHSSKFFLRPHPYGITASAITALQVRVIVSWITLTRTALPQPTARSPTPPPPSSPVVEAEVSGSNELMVVEDSGPTEVPPATPPFAESSHGQPTAVPPPPPAAESQDWSQLISRVDKKFSCLLCIASSPSVYFYNGRTEVVFHVVTRHLLRKEIEDDLAHHRKLTNKIKQRIGVLFVDGMHIRSGVHYKRRYRLVKDAERVEAALFHSVELHLRWKAVLGADASLPPQNIFTCSGCQAVFHNEQMAVNHINQELRAQLPDFMRARSCPWSLSARDEWVWCVPDLQPSPTSQQQHPPPPSQTALSPTAPSSSPHDSFSATSLTMETGLPKSLLFASINNTAASPSSSASRRLCMEVTA